MPLKLSEPSGDAARSHASVAEQARRLREAGELLRGAHPEHAAACVFAAVILEAESEPEQFRR